MRKICSLLLLIPCLFSCNSSNKQNTSKISDSVGVSRETQLSLPLGMKRLATIDFPTKWQNEPIDDQAADFSLEHTSSNDYNRLFYFVQKNYSTLYDSLNIGKPKYSSKPILPFTDPVKYDPEISAVGSVWTDKKYKLMLYKDGGKYNKLPASDESGSTLNYLYLVTEHGGKPLDSLIIYYAERDPVLSRRQYYLIDGDKTIHLYRFEVEEEETTFQEKMTYRINSDGKFVAGSNPQPVNRKAEDLSKWKGRFSVLVEGETTTAGTSNTKWTINIDANSVQVNSVTFHEPVLCNGPYRAVEKAGRLELFYDGIESSCKKPTASFVIKKEHGKYFAQGPFGESNVGQWLELSLK